MRPLRLARAPASVLRRPIAQEHDAGAKRLAFHKPQRRDLGRVREQPPAPPEHHRVHEQSVLVTSPAAMRSPVSDNEGYLVGFASGPVDRWIRPGPAALLWPRVRRGATDGYRSARLICTSGSLRRPASLSHPRRCSGVAKRACPDSRGPLSVAPPGVPE